MGKFERETLPKALVDYQARLATAQRESQQLATQLDAGDEWGNHDCDCDYCESKNYTPMSATERHELETKYDTLQTEIKDIETFIKKMITYKAYVEKIGVV